MTDTELRDALDELAESPAPPMRLDLDRARRAGVRRRRLRRAPGAMGAVALLVAAGVTMPQMIGADDDPPATPGPERTVLPTSGVEAPPARVNTQHNPMVAHATFGWLPEQLTGIGVHVGAHGDAVEARSKDGQIVWLTVYDKKPSKPPPELGPEPAKIPVLVDGREGYWYSTDAGRPLNFGSPKLRWKLPDGRWAYLTATYLRGPDVQGTILRIAENVQPGAHLVPLPLRISELPDDFRLSDGLLLPYPGAGMPESRASGMEFLVELIYDVNGAFVKIDVQPGARSAAGGGRSGAATCKVENGLSACVEIVSPGSDPLGEIGGRQGLLDRITLLGPDRSQWTTRVIG